MKKNKYKHGLPFSEIVGANIDALKTRIKKKKASMIVIDGLQGEGKSTLAIEVLEHYQKGDIDANTQYAMGGQQFQEKFIACKDRDKICIIYDEAGDFNKRGAITKFNQDLNRVFETFRTFKIMVILVLPCFNILDNNLFINGVPRLLMNCHNRGDTFGDIRGYDLESMFYIKNKMKNYIVPHYAYRDTTPNFRGHFLDLTPEKSAMLDKLSTEGKTEIINKNILKNKGLINLPDSAKEIGMSPRWVNNRMTEIRREFPPATKYGGVDYYDRGIITRLRQEIKQKK